MPRGKRKPVEDASIRARIRQAEKTINTGVRETVHVSDEQLEVVLRLIEKHGMTKAQVLRKAVRLGIEVLSQDLYPKKEQEQEPDRGYASEKVNVITGIARDVNEQYVDNVPLKISNEQQSTFFETLDRLGIPREAATVAVEATVEVESPFVPEEDPF